ncbi:MAG TPA: hypothetical protein VKB12_22125 [Pyrinomonadaceae bacterium]|nr:hypothetical protein [Pyrinomonadaceae bacterium]
MTRELVWESRECNVCGARVLAAREASGAEVRAVTSVKPSKGERPARVTRVRSGLAHAAGFAGVLYLFGYSVAPLALTRWWFASGASPLVVWGLFAPLALGLAFAAGVSLDRSREKAGALPAMFGLVVGLWGTFELLLMCAPWLRHLKAF